jgi:medium-chain acyl-[acyl-carrier-protein] hydrolase
MRELPQDRLDEPASLRSSQAQASRANLGPGLSADVSRYLVRNRPRLPPLLRLFCFPCAGGTPSMYRQWSQYLPAWIDLVPVLIPGRESRISEAPFADLEPLTDEIVKAIESATDVPYALFGHSMGSLVAFEAARRLNGGSGRGPSLLMVAGHCAPHLRPRRIQVHSLPDDDFVNYLREIDGTAPEVFEDPSLLEIVMPVLRADFTACETYVFRPGPQLGCPITAFRGIADVEIDESDLASWSMHTTAEFRSHNLPGGHFFVNTAQAQMVSLVIRECTRVVAKSFTPE